MIEMEITEDDGDRTFHRKDTGALVGWIEQGRRMTDLDHNWTEWQFCPAAHTALRGPVRDSYPDAREDLRDYVESGAMDAAEQLGKDAR